MKKIDKIALLEWSKEALRWVGLFVVAWFISETLKQIGAIPEFYTLKVWVLQYMIPVRALFLLGLTVLARFVDKLLHANDIKTPLDLKSMDKVL